MNAAQAVLIINNALVAEAIQANDGIQRIRPIGNKKHFHAGIRFMGGKWTLWYEIKNPFGWTSSIVQKRVEEIFHPVPRFINRKIHVANMLTEMGGN